MNSYFCFSWCGHAYIMDLSLSNMKPISVLVSRNLRFYHSCDFYAHSSLMNFPCCFCSHAIEMYFFSKRKQQYVIYVGSTVSNPNKLYRFSIENKTSFFWESRRFTSDFYRNPYLTNVSHCCEHEWENEKKIEKISNLKSEMLEPVINHEVNNLNSPISKRK